MTNTTKTLRCVHRHTIKEHPGCFAQGRVNYESDKQFEKVTGRPWYECPGTKIGYFDIEVDNLNADFGSVLTWAIKAKGGGVVYSVVTTEELTSADNDKRVVAEFVDAIREFDVLVGFYSSRFDLPYMRAKALHHNLDFPGYGDIYHWDLYDLVRAKMKISSRSLANSCDYLGIKGKTPLDKDVWRKAKYGDVASLKLVLEHNIADVDITEKLHDRLSFARKFARTSV